MLAHPIGIGIATSYISVDHTLDTDKIEAHLQMRVVFLIFIIFFWGNFLAVVSSGDLHL